MPKVIGTVTTDGNTTTTQFTGTVTNNAQTFYFNDTQDSMVFSTDGHSELTLKVDGRSYIVRPNVPVEIYEDFSSFNITRKDKGSQLFQLTSYVYADDNDAIVVANVEDVLTSTNAKNALSANQGRVLNATVQGINEFKYEYTYLPDGSVHTITEKDEGSVVISTTTFSYLSNGDVNTIVKVINGQTITSQYNYDVDGNLQNTINTIS